MTGLELAAAVSAAGAVGATGRYLIDAAITRRFAREVPRGTMTVNVIGSFVLGLTSGLVAHHHLGVTTGIILGTGFCGGLTSASSAAFETARLAHQRREAAAIATIVLGIGFSCLAGSFGLGIALT